MRVLPHDDRASRRFRLGRCLRDPPRISTPKLGEIEQISTAQRGVRRFDKNVFDET